MAACRSLPPQRCSGSAQETAAARRPPLTLSLEVSPRWQHVPENRNAVLPIMCFLLPVQRDARGPGCTLVSLRSGDQQQDVGLCRCLGGLAAGVTARLRPRQASQARPSLFLNRD